MEHVFFVLCFVGMVVSERLVWFFDEKDVMSFYMLSLFSSAACAFWVFIYLAQKFVWLGVWLYNAL